MLTKLLSDLYIISLLDDEPNDVGGMSSAELKAKFDEAANTIKTYINESLIPELAGVNGAGSVGIDTVPGLTGVSSVQAALAKIEEQMAEMTQGAVADGSITAAKLAADAKDIVMTGVTAELSMFTEDASNEAFGIKCTIPIASATSAMIPEVIFPDAAVDEMHPSIVAQTGDGAVIFNCKRKPTAAITIPTIILHRPGGVGSAGGGSSGAYEPYSGPYEVEPSPTAQPLATKDKLCSDNINITGVPRSTTTNQGGGKTVNIGG